MMMVDISYPRLFTSSVTNGFDHVFILSRFCLGLTNRILLLNSHSLLDPFPSFFGHSNLFPTRPSLEKLLFTSFCSFIRIEGLKWTQQTTRLK